MSVSLNARQFVFTLCVLGGSLALLGCPKEPEVSQATPTDLGPASSSAKAPAPSKSGPSDVAVTPVTPPREVAPERPGAGPMPLASSAAPAASPITDVFFAFDDSTIRGDQRTPLNGDFTWLRDHPQTKITVSGHCDERGTEEYNLALGQRRAEAVKEYLTAAGIPPDRITIVSYGKDRPFATGHDEDAWRLNRRAHFAVNGASANPGLSSTSSEGSRAASR